MREKSKKISSFTLQAASINTRADGGRNLVAALEWDGSDNDLVVEGSECSSNEWSDPEDPLQSRNAELVEMITPFRGNIYIQVDEMNTYVVIPSVLFVVDDRCTETTGRVDAGSSDGNGCQVNQEHSESNGEWCQNLQINTFSKNSITVFLFKRDSIV